MSLAEVPDRIDTLIVPGGGVPPDFSFTPGEHDIPEEQTPDVVAAALQMVGELAPRARRVASVCTGAFVLASLGLLDGRRATTHWAHCQELARTYPEIEVVPDSLFVQDGPYITGGAGISAGIDLGLAMVESDYGPDVARRVARWMVVFLQRPGGQAQFSVWTEAALRSRVDFARSSTRWLPTRAPIIRSRRWLSVPRSANDTWYACFTIRSA